MLDPGVYADSLWPGEQLMYRVPVDWGQSARMTVTAGPDPLAGEVLGVQGNTMEMTGYTPFRQKLHPISYAGAPVRDSDFYNGAEPTSLTFATAPVRLRNAEAFDLYVDSTTAAGDYWFGVEMGRLSELTRFAAPLTIEVEVVGDVAGEPVFTGSPSPAAEPAATKEAVTATLPMSTRRRGRVVPARRPCSGWEPSWWSGPPDSVGGWAAGAAALPEAETRPPLPAPTRST